jgi:hypothetical protein
MPITPPFSIAAFNSGFDIKPFIASRLGASPIIVILFALSTEWYTPVLLKPDLNDLLHQLHKPVALTTLHRGNGLYYIYI